MPKNMNPLERVQRAILRAVGKSQYQIQERGIVGWQISASQVVIRVPGRPNFLYVTRPDKTVHIARNQLPVPQSAFYPVRMVLQDDTYVIIARDNTDGNVFAPVPDSPSGVLPHPIEEHSDVVLTGAAANDLFVYDGDEWVNSPRATVVAGAISSAATDDTIVDADIWGYLTGGVLVKTAWSNIKAVLKTYFDTLYATIANGVTGGDTHDHNGGDGAQINHTTLSNIGTNSHATIDTHIAATAAHGATGAVVGTTNAQTLTNKTLDSTNISTLTAKNPPVDADSAVIVDSAAANVFKRTLWSDIKAFLKTYFDTIYGRLAVLNTWTENQTIASTTTIGNALQVIRNFGSASTNGAVVNIIDDHASDDQTALRVQQDGTGNILSLFDGAVEAVTVEDGGQVGINNAAPAYLLHLLGSGAVGPLNGTYLAIENVGSGGLADLRCLNDNADRIQFIAFGTAFAGNTFGETRAGKGMLIWSGATNFIIGTLAAGNLGFATNDVRRMTIDTAGKVMIGLTSIGANILGIKAGTSTNDAAVGGVLFVDTTTRGNVSTTETDLSSYSVSANELAVNNQYLELVAWGSRAANGNTKTIKLHFGSDNWTIVSSGGTQSWRITARIFRTGAATQKVEIEFIIDGGTPQLIHSTATRTLSSANTLKFTGQSSAATDDVQQLGMTVEWRDANN